MYLAICLIDIYNQIKFILNYSIVPNTSSSCCIENDDNPSCSAVSVACSTL